MFVFLLNITQAFERELAAQVSGKTALSDRRPGSSHKQPHTAGTDRHHTQGRHHYHKPGYKPHSHRQPSDQHRPHGGGKCSAYYIIQSEYFCYCYR